MQTEDDFKDLVMRPKRGKTIAAAGARLAFNLFTWQRKLHCHDLSRRSFTLTGCQAKLEYCRSSRSFMNAHKLVARQNCIVARGAAAAAGIFMLTS